MEKSSNSSPELESSYLKSEIDYLRTELDKLTRQNTNSLIDLKHYHEQQLSKLLTDKESLLQSEFSTISRLQKSLAAECDESSKLRQQILTTKLSHSDKYSELTHELEQLLKETDYIRTESIKSCKEEINQYQGLIESKRLEYSKRLRSNENEKHGELYDLEVIVENDEKKIKELEYQIEGIRAKRENRSSHADGEVMKVHSTLRSTQRIAQQQEVDLEMLRVEREKAKQACRDNEKEFLIAKHKVEVLKSENEELKNQLKRLERLTYGC